MDQAKAVIFSMVILAWTSGAMAGGLTAEGYTVRILEPPAEHPTADCELYAGFDLPCGAGPGFASGLDNQGNVIGPLETTFPHEISAQDMGVWLRSTGYTGENRGKFKTLPGQIYRGKPVVFPGPKGDLRAFGFIDARKVTSEGIVYGVANIGNGSLARYDIATDEWRSMGYGGIGARGNNNGIMVDGAKAQGAAFGEFDSRVFDTNLVAANGPFGVEDAGVIQTFPAPFFVPAISASDINDDNIMVGSFDDAVDSFPDAFGHPIRLVEDAPGSRNWVQDLVMGELQCPKAEDAPCDGVSRAVQISNSTPPFAIGWSSDENGQQHGSLWNVETGDLLVDFGGDRCRNLLCGAHDISPDGTMVVGARTTGFGPFAEREHFIAYTTDGWLTHEEVNANALLKSAPGGEHIEEITKLTGINDSGQVTAQGLIKGEFGEYLTPGVSAWDPAVATDPDCLNSDPGVWERGNGCGIPLLLDTKSLSQLLRGDMDLDGLVTNLDITPFIGALAAEDEAAFLALFPGHSYGAADVDGDGAPTNLDITPFIDRLAAAASSSAAVPEPASLVLLMLPLLAQRRMRRG